ncbi:MAG: DUF3108 domain-containing protein [Bacteroidota bacterium]
MAKHPALSSVVYGLLLMGGVLMFPGMGPSVGLTETLDGGRSLFAADSMPPALQVGEELEYHVSYSFFSIGTITFKILDKEQRDGRTVYRAQTIIESNPSLSWLTEVHIRFYGEMDEDVFSYRWVGEDSLKEAVNFRQMDFKYDQQKMYFTRGKRFLSGETKLEPTDTIPITSRCQDGLSLFFYAREHVLQKKQEVVPTFIENTEQKTVINFLNERTDADCDAVDYPVDVVHFDGRADFVGVFGLTGGFEGWFSNDAARVPILARMKVILGSVKVQLKSWKRPGWQPPKYVEAE